MTVGPRLENNSYRHQQKEKKKQLNSKTQRHNIEVTLAHYGCLFQTSLGELYPQEDRGSNLEMFTISTLQA